MTKIAWTEKTWNPVVGCTKVSPGCDNCYAERMAERLCGIAHAKINKGPNNVALEELATNPYLRVMNRGGGWLGETCCIESALEIPLHWKKPRKIFVCSMGDLFHESVPFEFIHSVWDIMKGCPQHTFQILTKRPERMKEVVGQIYRMESLGHANGFWNHCWLGVTCENQEQYDIRWPILSQIPAAVRFISGEPLLSGIELWSHNDLFPDWIIVGCESGSKRRICRIEWVRYIVRQRKAIGEAVFVKQLSIDGKVSKNMAEWPEELQIQKFPVDKC